MDRFAGFSSTVGTQAGATPYKILIFNGLETYITIYKPPKINKLQKCVHTIALWERVKNGLSVPSYW
jgi:hypothetical protein